MARQSESALAIARQFLAAHPRVPRGPLSRHLAGDAGGGAAADAPRLRPVALVRGRRGSPPTRTPSITASRIILPGDELRRGGVGLGTARPVGDRRRPPSRSSGCRWASSRRTTSWPISTRASPPWACQSLASPLGAPHSLPARSPSPACLPLRARLPRSCLSLRLPSPRPPFLRGLPSPPDVREARGQVGGCQSARVAGRSPAGTPAHLIRGRGVWSGWVAGCRG